MKKFKVALALGGGGVRGLAHLGVFKALEREHISIDLIVGTSMGAVIGGGFALSGHSFSLEQRVLGLLKRKEIVKLESLAGESRPDDKKKIIEGLTSFVKELLLWNLKGIKRWVADGDEIKLIIRELIKDAHFNQTKIPFACVACDLRTGEEVILNEGRLLEAIMASSAVAAVFPPIQIGERLLIDGAITSEIPIEAARTLGADFVIAVNVESKIFHDKFKHGMEILFQSDEIRSHELVRLKLKQADFVIHPPVDDISWAAFSQAQKCMQAGEQATLGALNQLKRALDKKKRAQIFKKLFFFR